MKSFSIIIAFIAFFFFACNTEKEQKNESNIEETTESGLLKKRDSLSFEIRKNPEKDQLFSERSSVYFMMEMLDSAINDIEIANRLDPTKFGYLLRRADMEILRGQPEMARTALTKILLKEPLHFEANLKMANLSLILEEYSNARNILNMILKAEPNNPQALFMRSMISQFEGEYDSAVSDLMKAVTSDPNYYEAHNMLGLLKSYIRDDLAIDFFNNAINIKPNLIEPRYNLGYYYQSTGRGVKAIEQYKYILQNIDSTALDPMFNIGYIYQEFKEYQQSIKFFKLASLLYPNEARVFYQLGRSYENVGNREEAIENYQRAVSIAPEMEIAFDALEKITR
ncbi:MAG: tetratricopeptide repeat protein [Salinivirgaceae bacterium]|nr:tetratricopeptide repeat protein [Salinivirgaceae bacterium]MDD4746037.1 tetratricopeptide repeat protein [Salinivirgaceae bacterium]MDY0281597.1 tetratricopeptide repeat protein [Salinivirgaceae bacterium]